MRRKISTPATTSASREAWRHDAGPRLATILTDRVVGFTARGLVGRSSGSGVSTDDGDGALGPEV